MAGVAGPSPGRRAEQVAAEVTELVSSLLLHEIRDPRLAMVAITKVKVTADLGIARIFFTMLDRAGETEESRAAVEGLKKAASFMRRRVAEQLSLRHVPELVFAYDVGLDDARRIDSLLDRKSVV